MKRKTVFIVLAALVIIAAVLAVIHISSQPKTGPGEFIISENGRETHADLNKLDLKDVKGTITMASGKTKDIDSKGIELKDLLKDKGTYTKVIAAAEDAYTAELEPDDINKDANVFIIAGDENKPRLVVMSDTNAKRDVKNLLRLELIP